MQASTYQTVKTDIHDKPRFVALVSSGRGDKIVVMTSGGHNFYYTIDGLRNLHSRSTLEVRIEINSMIDLLNATSVEDMFVDLNAVPNTITREMGEWER